MNEDNIELVFNTWSDAITVAETLMQNDYVVMLSYEEELTILNAVWSDGCDRNDVVFMSRDNFDEYYKLIEEDDPNGN